jgi:pimeloyl-ACP methyl ester carboxylesterase
VDKGAEPDPRLRNLRRRIYRSRLAAQMEFEALVNDQGRVEVAGVWIDRRWINDKAQLPMAITAWARFLEDALGTLSLKESVGNALAVSYEITTTFRALLGVFPFVPRDGVGAATEVFLGRRMDANATVMNRGATVVFRNDQSGRFYTGIALQGTYFELGALLFHGTEDDFVPPSNSERLNAAIGSAGPHELVLIPGADHDTISRAPANALFEQKLGEFLRR